MKVGFAKMPQLSFVFAEEKPALFVYFIEIEKKKRERMGNPQALLIKM